MSQLGLYDGRETVEWKSLSTTSVDQVVWHLRQANQSPRFVVKLPQGWPESRLTEVVRSTSAKAKGSIEEITFITPEGVYRWKG